VRDQLTELAAITLWQVRTQPRKSRCRTAGLIVSRQRPATAKGFAFFVIEDGATRGQVIISPDLWATHRTLLRDASILIVDAVVEDTGYQLTLKAERLAALPAPVTVRGYHYG
jgi:error-prone DNA polymerase